MRDIDLWYSSGSTYTYLSIMRLNSVESDRNVKFRLRPFYLVNILEEIGHIPFLDAPSKLRYMWRDLQRRAAQYGFSPKLPAPFPTSNTMLANRIAYVALQKDWGREYVEQSFRQWIERGHPVGDEPNISNSLRFVNQDPIVVVEQALSEQVNEALIAETDVARTLGIFGSPTFVIGDEIFWGDDRLEDAVGWAIGH
jgi:2-hydroxychromene-2-carboxylate isomerase